MNKLKFFKNNLKRYSSVVSLAGGIFLVFPILFSLLGVSKVEAINVSPPRMELNGDPGGVINSEFKVINDSPNRVTYYTQVENFEAGDESGTPQFVQSKEGLAVWTSVEKSVTLEPDAEATIPFSIQIPSNAEPGGYFASIFVRTTPPASKPGEVSVGARVGTLLLVHVNGEIQEGVDIIEFSTKNKDRWFTSLPIEFYYRFQNTGSDWVKPVGDIIIRDLVGLKAKVLNANRQDGSVLPRSIRKFETAWITSGGGKEDTTLVAVQHNSGKFFEEAKYQWNHFAFGYYTANLDISFGPNNNTASGKFRFFVFPWQLLVVITVIAVILIILLRFGIRRYNKHIISKHTPPNSQI